jgi:hypothetical protein
MISNRIVNKVRAFDDITSKARGTIQWSKCSAVAQFQQILTLNGCPTGIYKRRITFVGSFCLFE